MASFTPDDKSPLDPLRSAHRQEVSSEDFLFHLYRGSELLQDNRVHEAKEELETALRLQPLDAKGQDLLAVVYFRLGMYPHAMEIFEKLVQAYPHERTPRVNLALCYLKTGQPIEARQLLEETVRSHSDNLRAWSYLGLAYERLGEYPKAREAFLRAGQEGMARRMNELISELTPFSRSAAGPISTAPPRQEFQELEPHQEGAINWNLSGSEGSEGSAENPQRSADTKPASPRGQSAPPPSYGWLLDPPPSLGATRLHSTLPPPPLIHSSPSPPSLSHGASLGEHELSFGTTSLAKFARDARLSLPPTPRVAQCALGLLGIHVTSAFACRRHALRATVRAQERNFSIETMVRRVRGKPEDHVLGGLEDPMMLLSGNGHLLLGPYADHQLHAVTLTTNALHLREDLVVGFDATTLSYESGSLVGEDKGLPMIQLNGEGVAIFETHTTVYALEATGTGGVCLPREHLCGWVGQLVPRALSPSESPLPGWVSFAGEGTLFLKEVLKENM